MSIVYRYTDMNDNIIKYVGMSRNYDTFVNRVEQHARNDELKFGCYLVEYLELQTRTDAESLEAHFITKYNTGEYFNARKVGYGLLSFYDDSTAKWKYYANILSGGVHGRTKNVCEDNNRQ